LSGLDALQACLLTTFFSFLIRFTTYMVTSTLSDKSLFSLSTTCVRGSTGNIPSQQTTKRQSSWIPTW
jgi:hypothetical protein